MTRGAGLTDAAERAVLREVRRAWDEANALLFHGALRPPVLALTAAAAELGAWVPKERVLRLSWGLLLDHPWGAVVEVLRHEMAHQYVHEVLGAQDETPHGPTFREVCARRGIDASAHGTVGGAPVALPEVVARVRKLLALAASDNAHEADAAVRAARRLLARHHLDASALEETPTLAVRQLGRPRARVPSHERLLVALLTRFFHVEALWVSGYDVAADVRGRVAEIAGRPAELEVAVWVYGFVLEAAQRAFAVAPLSSRGERTRFLQGFVLGLADRLAAEDARVASPTRGSAPSTALAPVGDVAAADWLRRRYPARRRGRAIGVAADEATRAGRAEGRKLVLRRVVTASGTGGGALPGPTAAGRGRRR